MSFSPESAAPIGCGLFGWILRERRFIMAIVKMPQSATLGLRVQTGVGATGAPVYKNVNFNSLKSDAVDDSTHAIAQALSGLQKHTLVAINLVETANLIEQ
jgi:hypothetical protein